MLRSVLVGSLLALWLAVPAVAQDEPVLDPALLGEGWSALDVRVGLQAEGGWSGGLTEYGGPAGARVIVTVATYDATPATARKLWTLFNEGVDKFRAGFDADYSSEDDLAERTLPLGCADARRIAGTDKLSDDTQPVAVVLCANDPNRIVLVLTSGQVGGVSGIAAAEHVVELITASDSATPTP